MYEVINTLTRISRQDGCVKFMWVPAHCGLSGNEKADGLANQALNKEAIDPINSSNQKYYGKKLIKCGKRNGRES